MGGSSWACQLLSSVLHSSVCLRGCPRPHTPTQITLVVFWSWKYLKVVFFVKVLKIPKTSVAVCCNKTKYLWNCVLKSTHLQYYCKLICSYKESRVVWLQPFQQSNKILFVLFTSATRKRVALIISISRDCTSPPNIKIWSQKWKKPVREFGSFSRALVSLQLSNYDGKKGRPFWSNWWRLRLSASICVICSLLSG